MRNVTEMSYHDRQRLYHDFWKVFNANDIEESYERHWKLLAKINAMNMAIVALTEIGDPDYDKVIAKLTVEKKLKKKEYDERY